MITSRNQRNKIGEKQLALRKQLWPDLKEESLWRRKVSQGFITIPRTMPLILAIMDSLSKNRPVSSTYLDLWCRTFDECFVTLNKSKEMAFHAGFSGQRAEQTWTDRMKALANLKFIDIKPGPSGPLSYALIWNPYHVIKEHHRSNTPGMRQDLYNTLAARAIEIGAKDL